MHARGTNFGKHRAIRRQPERSTKYYGAKFGLAEKSNSIVYHRIREAVAAGILHFFHIRSTENIADILTKPLGPKIFYGHIKGLLFGSIRST